MYDRHLRKAEDHDESNKTRDRIAQDDCGSGIADRDTAAHEEARADGAAEPHHDHLRPGETLGQAFFACADRRIVNHVAVSPDCGPSTGLNPASSAVSAQLDRLAAALRQRLLIYVIRGGKILDAEPE